MNKIEEIIKLHSKHLASESELTELVDQLKDESADFRFKFTYKSPTSNGVVIERKDGTNSMFVDGSNTYKLCEFLIKIFINPTTPKVPTKVATKVKSNTKHE